MKKNLLKWGALFAVPALLSSCNLDESTDDRTTRMQVPVYNHIARNAGTDAEVVATTGTYILGFNLTQGKMSASTTSLKFDNSDHTFTTDSIAFENTYYTSPSGTVGNVFTFQSRYGNIGAAGSATVTSFKGCVTPFFYRKSSVQVPGYPVSTTEQFRMILSYTYSDMYRVRAFYPDVFFAGKTSTTYPGGTSETEEPLYRLVMDVTKKTADLIIYDVKFADAMPPIPVMIVKGLALKFTQKGYEAESTEDIIPVVIEGNAEQPYPLFPFNSVKVSNTSSDLTEAAIEFEVAGKFQGKFSGSSIAQGFKTEK